MLQSGHFIEQCTFCQRLVTHAFRYPPPATETEVWWTVCAACQRKAPAVSTRARFLLAGLLYGIALGCLWMWLFLR